MHERRPDDTRRPEHDHPTDAAPGAAHPRDAHPGDAHSRDDHPALVRLRAEFTAARDGMAGITALTLPFRKRVVEAIRTGLPDIAGRAAHEAGAVATVAEIRRFTTLGVDHADDACPVVTLWGRILDDATEAASAASTTSAAATPAAATPAAATSAAATSAVADPA